MRPAEVNIAENYFAAKVTKVLAHRIFAIPGPVCGHTQFETLRGATCDAYTQPPCWSRQPRIIEGAAKSRPKSGSQLLLSSTLHQDRMERFMLSL